MFWVCIFESDARACIILWWSPKSSTFHSNFALLYAQKCEFHAYISICVRKCKVFNMFLIALSFKMLNEFIVGGKKMHFTMRKHVFEQKINVKKCVKYFIVVWTICIVAMLLKNMWNNLKAAYLKKNMFFMRWCTMQVIFNLKGLLENSFSCQKHSTEIY